MTPEERKQYQRDYYLKNKEKLLAAQKIRGAKNYQENKEKYKERNQRWRKENPEKYRQLTKNHAEKNKEKIKARSAEWYQNNKERASAQSRKQKLASYGMTQGDYVAMLKAQNGVCAICGEVNPIATKKRLHIDHCHQTGEVRGLLCHHCNVGLGSFKDDVQLLRLAIAYLNSM